MNLSDRDSHALVWAFVVGLGGGGVGVLGICFDILLLFIQEDTG